VIRALILVSAAVVKKSVVSPRDLQVFVSESQTTSIQILSHRAAQMITGLMSNRTLICFFPSMAQRLPVEKIIVLRQIWVVVILRRSDEEF
jgi:hypothetical protein